MTFNYIQVCRGIAAMMVVAFHTGASFAAEKYFGEPLFARLFRFGSSGVEFFFVLSGFIIYFVHHADFGVPAAVKRYAIRRLERVYPTYWLIFSGVFAVALAIPAFRSGVPTEFLIILKSLFLVPQNPEVVGGTGAPVIIVAWSLQYELVFYFVFALFIFSPLFGFASVLALSIWWLLSAAGWGGPKFILEFLQPHYFLIFAFGVVSARISVQHRVSKPFRWVLYGALIYAAFAGFEVAEMFVKQLPRSPGRTEVVSLGYGIGAALLIAGLVALESRRQRLVPSWLARMGDASYVLYLAHFPIISACAKVFTALGSGVAWAAFSFVFTFTMCCAFSLVFWRYIERPMLKFLRDRSGSLVRGVR